MGAKIGHEVSEVTRAKIRAALAGRPRPDIAALLRGKTQSPEAKRKRSESLRRYDPVCVIADCGKPHMSRGWCGMHYYRWRKYGDPLFLPPRATGPDARNWKGDDISYDAAHRRAKNALPGHCESCGTDQGRLEIALRKDSDPARWQKSSQHNSPYSPDPGDYARLCVRCHRRYDSPRADTRAPIIQALEK